MGISEAATTRCTYETTQDGNGNSTRVLRNCGDEKCTEVRS